MDWKKADAELAESVRAKLQTELRAVIRQCLSKMVDDFIAEAKAEPRLFITSADTTFDRAGYDALTFEPGGPVKVTFPGKPGRGKR